MRRFVCCALLASAAAPALAAQGNPFKLQLKGLPNYTVEYAYGGDMSGTGRTTSGDSRFASMQTRTGKFFGKTSTTSTWSMTDPEYIWTADVDKKTGTKSVNPLPSMAKAYDDLDGAGKARFHSNMEGMMQFVTRAFPGMSFRGEKKGTRTYAGESCELTELGGFSYCTMSSTPVTLYASGTFLCIAFEETATKVSRSSDASLFEPPAGIKWTEELDRPHADSMARAFVGRMASQELADSIAKARSEAASHGNGNAQQMTPEQQKQMCDALKNFSLSKAMNDAFKEVVASAAKEAKDEAIQGAKDDAKNKIKRGLGGLIKRP